MYGSYKYRRELAKAAIVGPLVQQCVPVIAAHLAKREADPLNMSEEVAWKLALRYIRDT